jgi:hypothetical protein
MEVGEAPDDLESSDRYIAVPRKNELNLGRDLALSFVDGALSGEYDVVAGFFRKKEGAYAPRTPALSPRAGREEARSPPKQTDFQSSRPIVSEERNVSNAEVDLLV